MSALINLTVADYYERGGTRWLRFQEKRGKEHEVVPRHVVSWDLRQKYFVGKVGQCLAQSRDVSHSFEDRRESALASEALNSGAIRYVQESNPA